MILVILLLRGLSAFGGYALRVGLCACGAYGLHGAPSVESDAQNTEVALERDNPTLHHTLDDFFIHFRA